MTIVFLCRLFYPHIGGVEKHVREVGKRLVRKGHKLIVITELFSEVDAKGKKVSLSEEIDGMRVYRIPVTSDEKGKKWDIWRWLWQHRQIWQQSDIIHCHDVFFWYLPFRLIYWSQRVFMTFHGYESYPIRLSAVRIRKVSEKLTTGNICIGEFMKKWYGTKPTFISYGGVTLEKANSSALEKESALFWGRLDDQTGILTYQAAMDIINKKYPQFSLTILGDGELGNKIDHRFQRLGFEQNIEKYLKNVRFAFVSRYLSILEALAQKKLVFAVYDNPVKEDYLKMTPFSHFIIIEKTPEKLAEKVLFFLKNPAEEKEKTDAGFNWVKTQTWENLVGIYEKLWDMKKRDREKTSL